MLPLAGGEVVYSAAAFGSRGGFVVGWAGVLMNAIVFCWVNLAAISLLDELFPGIGPDLFFVCRSADTASPCPMWSYSLCWPVPSSIIQYRGASVCAALAKIATVTLLVMCIAGLAAAFVHFDPAIYASDGGLDFDLSGFPVPSFPAVFSVAGWETGG